MNPTRRITVRGVKGMVLLLALALASCAPASGTRPPTETPQATKPQVLAAYGKLPLSFEANQGQTEPQVKFLSRGRGYTLFLTSTEAVLALREGASARNVVDGSPAAKRERGEALRGTVLRMRFVGANPAPAVAGVGELPGKSSYFVGNDTKKWRTNVPAYAKVEYRDVYPGVKLVYYGSQRQLEYDLVVSPGTNPKAITLAFEGVDGVAIDGLGDLVLLADGGEVRLRKPIVYQDHDGQRAVIPTRYVLKGERQVVFDVAAYDITQALIIDPVLGYSTYLGGSGQDEGLAIAVDAAGNAYVTGQTFSTTNFPTTPGAFQTIPGGAFVTKLNAAGSALLYSTYLGTGFADGLAIAVDVHESAYVTGFTNSSDLPTTPGAFQRTFGGGPENAFVTKLTTLASGLESLVYSTYLGAAGRGNGIAVDANGNAYVTGTTASGNFPTTPGAFQTTLGGSVDAFVTKLNTLASGLESLVYSTYLGGRDGDFGLGIAVDAAGNAYLTGLTFSDNFPTTRGAVPTVFDGGFGD